MRIRRLLIAASLPMLLALTACGQGEPMAYAGGPASPGTSSEQEEPTEPEVSESPEDDPSEDPSEDPSDEDGPDHGDDLTPPGTQLSYGESATVETTSLSADDATLDMTVNGVTTPSKQPTTYSTTVHIDITVTSTRDLQNLLVIPMFDWEVVDDRGNGSTLGFDDSCTAEIPNSMRAGESVDICVAVALNQGAGPAEVHYSNSSGSTANEPIVWTP